MAQFGDILLPAVGFLFLFLIGYFINMRWPVPLKEEYDPDSIDP